MFMKLLGEDTGLYVYNLLEIICCFPVHLCTTCWECSPASYRRFSLPEMRHSFKGKYYLEWSVNTGTPPDQLFYGASILICKHKVYVDLKVYRAFIEQSFSTHKVSEYCFMGFLCVVLYLRYVSCYNCNNQ